MLLFHRHRSSLSLLVIVVVGCADSDQKSAVTASPTASESDVQLIGEELRSHSFGAVVSKSNLKLKHSYPLANISGHDVKVIQLVNRKPCCAEVHIGKTILHPGDTTELEVTLSIRQEFGEILHETVVLTEPAQPEELILRTMARAYPPMRIEEVTSATGTVLLSSDKPKVAEFRVVAYGSPTEGLVDLHRIELRRPLRLLGSHPRRRVARTTV